MVPRVSRGLWFILSSVCIAHTLTLNLHNVSSPSFGSQDSNSDAHVHCTRDPNWLVPAFPNIKSYDRSCRNALKKAADDLISYGVDTEFEFLTRGATAQTSKPQIELPRKYVASKLTNLIKQGSDQTGETNCAIHEDTNKKCRG